METNENSKELLGKPPESNLKNLSKGYVTLPMDETNFKRFIVGLLGKPQTISKIIKGNFEVHLKDIQNFHDLISQRIEQQNKGRLIQFRTKIYYSDRSSVELGSYDELTTYNQVKPVVSIAVSLYWGYLIQFADKSVPEKQEITIKIQSTSDKHTIIGVDDLIFISEEGEFDITIHHTARSWGDDIEAMLTNQINSIILRENKIKTFIRENSFKIGVVIACLVFFCALYSVFTLKDNHYKSELQKVTEFNSSNPDLDKRVHYLTEYVIGGKIEEYDIQILSFILFSIFISVILGAIVKILAENKTPSFLILTRESLKNAEKTKEKLKRKWAWFFISILISIITGIMSNYIFKILIS